jgi:hypothetical protein
MRYMIATVMALMLFSVAIAASEKVTVGPYVVSFELNDSVKYTIEDQNSSLGKNFEVEPKRWNQRDIYSFEIKAEDNTGSRISISEWTNYTDATISSEIAYQNLLLRSIGYGNITGGMRPIDGNNGFFMAAYGSPDLVSGNKTFAAWYWIDKVDVPQAIVSYGKQKVTIAGNLSAESVGALLGSLEVKRS